MTVRTTREVAGAFGCSTRKVADTANTYGIGAVSSHGIGMRFDDADVEALWDAMRPRVEVSSARRRRRPRALRR